MISQAPGQVILRNYEGVISKYTEPDDYVEPECHCADCEAGKQRLGVAEMFDSAEPDAAGCVGGPHAEGRRPQEPYGRHVRTCQGLTRTGADGTGRQAPRRPAAVAAKGARVARLFVEPIGVTLEVGEQENLLDVLVRAAIDVPADCAGKGTCGKCLVRLGAGELSPPTERERKRVPDKLRADGWRLACQAHPVSARVSIEVRAPRGRRRILTTSKLHHGAAHPAVTGQAVALEAPTLADPRSDLAPSQRGAGAAPRCR